MGPADLVRAAYEAFGRRDYDAVRALLAEDAHMATRVESAEGTEGVLGLLRGFDDALDGYELTVEELTERGDTVVARVHQSGRGRGSGLEVDLRNFHVWRARDGRLASMRVVTTREEADDLVRSLAG